MTEAISPLRRRMIDDMSIRKFAAKTQHDYVQRVKDFATFLGRSPGTAASEDVRRFQAASGVERRKHTEDQRHRRGAAVAGRRAWGNVHDGRRPKTLYERDLVKTFPHGASPHGASFRSPI